MSSSDATEPETQEKPLTLDKLRGAFAKMMGLGGAGTSAEVAAQQAPPAAADSEPPAADDEQDPCPVNPGSILEAILFVGDRENRPLTAAVAADLMRDVEPEDIAPLVDALNRRYVAHGCPYRIVAEGPGYRLSLHKAFHPLRNRLYGRIRQARLSQAAVDVLAVVAYQQPLSGEEIGRLRGKPSSHLLNQLVRRGLLRIERPEGKRRGVRYYTTDRFLELFGLGSLEDLPQSEDLDR